MIEGIEAVMLHSANPRQLAEFYEKKVGLKLVGEYEMGEKGEEVFELGFEKGPALYINPHSEIHTESHEPERIFINFEVGDIDKAVAKMASAGVKVIKEKYHIEGYGYMATYADPDNNYFQLVQVRAS